MLNFFDQIVIVSRLFFLAFAYLFKPSLSKKYLMLIFFYVVCFLLYIIAIWHASKFLLHISFIDNILSNHPFWDRFVTTLFFFNVFFLLFPIYRYLTTLAISPFLGVIAIELYKEKMKREPKFDKMTRSELWIRSLKVNFKSLQWELLLNICLFPIRLFDFTFLSYLFSFIITSYFIGLSYMDFGLELYEKPEKETNQFVSDYRYMAVTIGMVYISCLFFPILGFVLAPILCITLGVNSVINIEEGEYKKLLS